jgi:hypothetical protein
MTIIFQKKTTLYYSISLLFFILFIFLIVSSFLINIHIFFSIIILILSILPLIISLLLINISLPIIITEKLLFVPRTLLIKKIPRFDYYDIFEIKNIQCIKVDRQKIELHILNGVVRKFNKNISKNDIDRMKKLLP